MMSIGRQALRYCNGMKTVHPRPISSSISYYDPISRRLTHHASHSEHESLSKPSPFQKVLIANRGEIACRVIKTCKKMGIETVAIYSTPDAKSPHVTQADEAVCVGPAVSSKSYLDIDNVCKAIEVSGAEAIHPGYGFLSENADFAKRVEGMIAPNGKNVKFIGPGSNAIISMGDKITSKRIAMEAGVNVIPGYDGIVKSKEEAARIANDIGYPVMIKATSGGGGKGMRICYNDEQVMEGFLLSSAEAKSFFNDERLFIEKYIESPHHIEIQLLAGRKVNSDGSEGELEILCFPERECSIQRRNQKILEESPSTLLQPETRAEMVRQVKRLVRKVDYRSAGTVEWLVDQHQNFYFLEMNTRLQVEHPVTEAVSNNVDLVYGMIEIAAGNGIPQEYLDMLGCTEGLSEKEMEGKSIPFHGHAIEARVYAEDPVRGFLPSTGPLVQYMEPKIADEGCGYDIRVDSGVTSGSIISQYYDPMISKLICFSPNNRLEAINGLSKALDSYVIEGIDENTSFLSDVLRHPSFIEGHTPTNFIPIHYPDGFNGVSLNADEEAEAVAVAATVSAWRLDMLDRPPLPLNKHDQWIEAVVCLGGMFGKPFKINVTDVIEGIVSVTCIGESNDSQKTHTVKIEDMDIDVSHPIVDCIVNGRDKSYQIGVQNSSGLFPMKASGAKFDVMVMSTEEFELSRFMKPPKAIDTSNLILSPMPGTLISYSVEDEQEVVSGQEICIVEAMKMQNVLRSTRAGKVKLQASVGSTLLTDEVIAQFISL